MSRATPPGSIRLPGPPALLQAPQHADSAIDDSLSPEAQTPPPHARKQRISFSANAHAQRMHRPSMASTNLAPGARFTSRRGSNVRSVLSADDERSILEEYKPTLPSLFTEGVIRREPDATPLPLLPMIVLGIAMMGEWLSANVSAPFLVQMVKSFGVEQASVGLWTGNLVSSFFITQFFTSLLWATIADRHGRRTVLFVTLLGNAATVILFGTVKSLPEAIVVRLSQGIFNGAIGVVRGGIKDITDPTNEAKAYARLSFVWGFGGVVGPVLGGLLESPAVNYPHSAVGQMQLFQTFPYLLPCLVAGSILVMGAILSLFLDPDGRARTAPIALAVEKDDEATEETPLASGISIGRNVSKRVSGYFASRVRGVDPSGPSRGSFTSTSSSAVQLRDNNAAVGSSASRGKRRATSSAYGYGGAGLGDARSGGRSARGSFGGRRRDSDATVRMERGEEPEIPQEEDVLGHNRVATFAERLLLANDGLSGQQIINDLWLSQAIALDNESVFEDEDDDEGVDGDDGDEFSMSDARTPDDSSSEPSSDAELDPSESPARASARSQHRQSTSTDPRTSSPHLTIPASTSSRRGPRPTGLGVIRQGEEVSPSSESPSFPSRQLRATSTSQARLSVSGNYFNRRFSVVSQRPPSLFAHTGLASPAASTTNLALPEGPGDDAVSPGLNSINEGAVSRFAAATASSPAPVQAINPIWKLPLFLIFQYFALAVHDTTNGQLFLSFLNTPYSEGGLGLNPAHFSGLVAAMCLCQLTYQFYLYPRLGPPAGPLTHVNMFRLGSLLFIPAYLTTAPLRRFASESEEGSPLLMAALLLNMACRYCGGTLTYTAIMILVNAMSPPEVVNLANGLAQSGVSAARFLGPICGGYLWSVSIGEGGLVDPFGFKIVATVCALALASSFFLR